MFLSAHPVGVGARSGSVCGWDGSPRLRDRLLHPLGFGDVLHQPIVAHEIRGPRSHRRGGRAQEKEEEINDLYSIDDFVRVFNSTISMNCKFYNAI